MKSPQFYCQNSCSAVDFSIAEWNDARKYCDDRKITGGERDRILHPEKYPCNKQCMACTSIVEARQIQTRELMNPKN